MIQLPVLGSEPRDLFLFPSAFGNRIHLHLRVNGAAKICAANAGGDDSARSNARRPKYLVSVAMTDSWLRRPGSDRLIFTWANEYIGAKLCRSRFREHYADRNRLLLRRCSAISGDSEELHPDLQTKPLSRSASHKFQRRSAQNQSSINRSPQSEACRWVTACICICLCSPYVGRFWSNAPARFR